MCLFSGIILTLDYFKEIPNPCSEDPCENSGICLYKEADNSFECSCTSGYTGEFCETVISTSPCASSPCKNGGTCFEFGSGFLCACTSNCLGTTCGQCLGDSTTRLTTTAAPTTTTSSFILCVDSNVAYCSYFASQNYCNLNAYINRVPIRVSCARSCNACSTTTTTTVSPGCFDLQKNCMFWSKRCSSIQNPYLCRRTCNGC